jgi:hypothetical protein
MKERKNSLSENLVVCRQCLMAIESREGSQATKKHYVDIEYDDNSNLIEEPNSYCDWCEDYGFDELYELV